MGNTESNALSYGNVVTEAASGGFSRYNFLYLLIPVIGIFILVHLLHGKKGGGQYRFIMDVSVGNEIVDTLGDIVMQD